MTKHDRIFSIRLNAHHLRARLADVESADLPRELRETLADVARFADEVAHPWSAEKPTTPGTYWWANNGILFETVVLQDNLLYYADAGATLVRSTSESSRYRRRWTPEVPT